MLSFIFLQVSLLSDLSKAVKNHEIYVSPAAERVLKELASKALLQHRTQELFFPLPRRPSSSAGLLIPNKNAAGVQATQSMTQSVFIPK